MPKVHGVLRLPVELRAALKQRIREYGYGEYLSHEQWLRGQGYCVSKSAIHRYGQRLKDYDDGSGADIEALADGGETLTALWERLAELRAEEDEVLGLIRGITQVQIGMSRAG